MSITVAGLTAALASASDIQFRCGAACEVHATSAYAVGVDYVLVSAVGIRQSSRAPVKKSITDLTSTVSVNSITFCKRLGGGYTAAVSARGTLTKCRTDSTSISAATLCAVGKHCGSAAHTSVHNMFGVAKRTADPVSITHLTQAALVKSIVDYCAVSARVTYGRAAQPDAAALTADYSTVQLVKAVHSTAAARANVGHIVVKNLQDAVAARIDATTVRTAQPDAAALTADYSTVQLVKAVHSTAAARANVGHTVVKNLQDAVAARIVVTTVNAPTQVVGDYGGTADATRYTFVKVISDGISASSRCVRDYTRRHVSGITADATDVQKQCGFGGSEHPAAHDMVGAAVGKRITDSACAASSSVCGVRPAANSDIGNLTFGLSAFGV